MIVKLIDVAKIIRSKNSGPYELTLDVIFKDWDMYDKVIKSKQFNKHLIAQLYGIDENDVLGIIEFLPAKAIKATIKRKIASGSIGETDVYGAQQHAPLLDIEFDLEDI
ncbi:MAG: DUF4387 domain-containing protein [Clostridia bacterium]|nr:DUF4387 domain-containing protein [Clostridia bacterium]